MPGRAGTGLAVASRTSWAAPLGTTTGPQPSTELGIHKKRSAFLLHDDHLSGS